MTGAPVRPGRRPGATALRLAGIVLVALLLVLGAAALLAPDPSPPVPTASPTPSTTPVSEPSAAPPSPSPSPHPSDPPELDPPVMTGTIRVGERPVALALDAQAGLGYTANQDGGDVSVIDLASGLEINTLPVPGRPAAVATGASGVLYVADRAGATVYPIDVATGARRAAWKVGKAPVALALDVDLDRLYVAVRKAVEIYDTTTGRKVASVPVAGPTDLALDERTHQLWVLWGQDGSVGRYQPATAEWTETELGGEGARGLEVDEVRHRLYLVGRDEVLEEHDLDAGAVRRIAVGQATTALRVDPGTRIAYLVDPDGNAVIALSLA